MVKIRFRRRPTRIRKGVSISTAPRLRGVLSGVVEPPPSFDFFISPTGSASGDGSFGDPWDLQTAFNGGNPAGAIDPGDFIGIIGGDYFLTNGWDVNSGCSGVPGNLVTFRNVPGQRPKIHNGSAGLAYVLDWFANYVRLWGIELYDSGWTTRNIDRHSFSGVFLRNGAGNGCELVNSFFHDTCQAMLCEADCVDTADFLMYGCVLYNHGDDAGPKGHNLYVHHIGGVNARMRFEKCLFGPSYGFGAQLFANSDEVDYMDFVDNAMWGGASLSVSAPNALRQLIIGGSTFAPRHSIVTGNMLYRFDSQGGVIDVGFSGGTMEDIEVGNNYIVGGGTGEGAFRIRRLTVPQETLNVHDNFVRVANGKRICELPAAETGQPSYLWADNVWTRDPTAASWFHAGVGKNFATWKADSGLGDTDVATGTDPATTKVFVLPTTAFEPGRGNVVIFNWQSLTDVPVNLAAVLSPGDDYKVWDARDLDGWWDEGGTGHVLSGTYAGGTVPFPMNTQKPDPAPIGGWFTDPPNTVPFYNQFLVRKV